MISWHIYEVTFPAPYQLDIIVQIALFCVLTVGSTSDYYGHWFLIILFYLFIYFFFHVLVVMRDWGWGPYICWSQRTTVQKRIKKKREEKMKKSSHDQYSKTISYHCFLLWSLKIQFVGSKWRVFALAH
jgi:hypothetical protein